MPRKPCHHRRHHLRDQGRRQRRLTNGLEEDAARIEDDDKDDEGRSKESGGRICLPGQKTGGLVGRRRVHCQAMVAAAGGQAPWTMAPKSSASAGVVVNDEIDGSSARRERGGEPRSSSSAVVGVAPLKQRGGVVWAPEAAARNALEGCVLTLEVGDVLLQALEEELLAQAPGCGCAHAGGPAGPGTSAARQGGRRRGPPPHDTAAAAAGAGAG